MNDELFKEEATKFSKIVEKTKAKKVAVDMREFRFQLSPELIVWRNEHVIAVYNKIGLKKFAFISDTLPVVKQDNSSNTFVTEYFRTIEDAHEWFVQS